MPVIQKVFQGGGKITKITNINFLKQLIQLFQIREIHYFSSLGINIIIILHFIEFKKFVIWVTSQIF